MLANARPGLTWALRDKSTATAKELREQNLDQFAGYNGGLVRLSPILLPCIPSTLHTNDSHSSQCSQFSCLRGWTDALAHGIASADTDDSGHFYRHLQSTATSMHPKAFADNLIATVIPSLPLFSAAITEVVDCFLHDSAACATIATLAQQAQRGAPGEGRVEG